MRQLGKAVSCVLLAACAAFAAGGAAQAIDYDKRVKKACAYDYQEYCSQYEPDSTQLRRCFESNRRGLSHYCITALIAAGQVPSSYLLRK